MVASFLVQRATPKPRRDEKKRLTDSLLLRKARGAFFTPPEMSQFIAHWALRSPADKVLEPAAGEASFLFAAGERLHALGATRDAAREQLTGVELDEPSAEAAHRLLADSGMSATIEVRDFFDVEAAPIYDACIGNPPYVRYQNFSGLARAKAMRAALEQGVRLTGLASAWAPFTVYATRFLKPDGRLGLVLPAELLATNYAANVRRFLLNRFQRVRLVMFEDLVFPGVLEEVVLLLAEGTGPAPSSSFEVFQARDIADLAEIERRATWVSYSAGDGEKWTPALLSSVATETYRALDEVGVFEPMLSWGENYLGSVTGNNDFFALKPSEAKSLGLTRKDLERISPPGSRHFRGIRFSEQAWDQLCKKDEPVYLFAPDAESPSLAALAYVKSGEKDDVQEAYKCRMRHPWWRVPVLRAPDLFLTYMDHERPRVITNEAGVHHLNSLYGVSLVNERRKLGRELLPLAMLNSATLLGAEMVGRAYGGGLLKLEPSEADRLLVPSLTTVEGAAPELRKIRGQVGKALRKRALLEAVRLVDRVLCRQLSMSYQSIRTLREARMVLFTRRTARGQAKRQRGKN